MNVANLQLKGLLMAIASINNMRFHKGVLSIDDIELVLHGPDACAKGRGRLFRSGAADGQQLAIGDAHSGILGAGQDGRSDPDPYNDQM